MIIRSTDVNIGLISLLIRRFYGTKNNMTVVIVSRDVSKKGMYIYIYIGLHLRSRV